MVSGCPDRILPLSTNLFNARPTWLNHARKALDEAVAGACGWGDDWRAGKLTEGAILARLFLLNQARAKAQAPKRPPSALS